MENYFNGYEPIPNTRESSEGYVTIPSESEPPLAGKDSATEEALTAAARRQTEQDTTRLKKLREQLGIIPPEDRQESGPKLAEAENDEDGVLIEQLRERRVLDKEMQKKIAAWWESRLTNEVSGPEGVVRDIRLAMTQAGILEKAGLLHDAWELLETTADQAFQGKQDELLSETEEKMREIESRLAVDF